MARTIKFTVSEIDRMFKRYQQANGYVSYRYENGRYNKEFNKVLNENGLKVEVTSYSGRSLYSVIDEQKASLFMVHCY